MSRTFGVDDSARAAKRHELLLDALEVHNETLERSLGGNEAKKLAAAFIQIEGNLRCGRNDSTQNESRKQNRR